MSAKSRLRGLYAITPQALCAQPQALLAAAAAAVRGGAVLLQYRDKRSPPERRQALARALLELCRRSATRLIVNDDVSLAAEVGADGVHLGATDAPIADARTKLGPQALLGASCGPSLERARAALALGADYLAFGRFYDSRTKPQAPPADIAVLRAARAEFSVPLCAIGGITPANAAPLIAAGADLIAAVEGVFGDPRPCAVEAAARAYAKLF
ncbi:MAG: thiamine phosphate synthase [Nevskia sp.]|nr:thiamine phosphate synthase [Nevskia sp.]